MISFECDYNNGAHPKVLEHLVQTNGIQSLTYGFDEWSEQAKAKIRHACQDETADVFLLVGGTQTNTTVIDGLLPSVEAVISVETGHISVHESGAIERSGHKVITLPSHEGKMHAADLRAFMQAFEADESRDHLAQPGMVYLSLPTELGTLYTAQEIEQIHNVCQTYGLKLYVDGARLGYALAASNGDITLPWLSRHCDAFYIGGTKVGALCGEAVVFPRGGAPRRFFSIIKQHGALLAKGRLAGIQFDALFTDNLYLQISTHAINMAKQLKDILRAAGFTFYLDSPTNQQFVIIPNAQAQALKKQVDFTLWGPYDDNSMLCRFVTSWATTAEDLDFLRETLASAKC